MYCSCTVCVFVLGSVGCGLYSVLCAIITAKNHHYHCHLHAAIVFLPLPLLSSHSTYDDSPPHTPHIPPYSTPHLTPPSPDRTPHQHPPPTAKDGALALEDMTGGTFTISNGGVFGSLFGTPIINIPQSAILGMHATKMRYFLFSPRLFIMYQ